MYGILENNPNLIEDELVIFATKYNIPTQEQIDHLAYDGEGNICVIEVKNEEAKKILEQGFSYVSWVTENQDTVKASVDEFYQKIKETELEKVEIKFDKPRLILVAPSFHDKVIRSATILTNLWRVPITLVTIKRYKREDEVYFDVNTVSPSRPARAYPAEYKPEIHFTKYRKPMRPLYRKLKECVMEKLGITNESDFIKIKKFYIGFYKGYTRFLRVKVRKDRLIVGLKLADSDLEQYKEKITTDVHPPWTAAVELRNEDDVEDVLPLIIASYENV